MNYSSSTPEFIKTMPIRNEIEILEPDIPSTLHNRICISTRGKVFDSGKKLEFKVKENIGVAIINPRGIKNLLTHE